MRSGKKKHPKKKSSITGIEKASVFSVSEERVRRNNIEDNYDQIKKIAKLYPTLKLTRTNHVFYKQPTEVLAIYDGVDEYYVFVHETGLIVAYHMSSSSSKFRIHVENWYDFSWYSCLRRLSKHVDKSLF